MKKALQRILSSLGYNFTTLVYFAIAGFGMWLLAILLYVFYGFSVIEWVKTLPIIYPIFQHVLAEIARGSFVGVLYLFLISSLFFFPIPLELIYLGLAQFVPMRILFIAALLGIVAGQIINYLLGRFFKFLFISFIKKESRRKIRHRLNRYGIIAVVLAHIIPFPFQLLNFVCGTLKYRMYRWIPGVILGITIKLVILSVVFV